MFSKISFIRIKFSVSLTRMTPITVPSTFSWHRLCNTDHRLFSFLSFSLSCKSFPKHAFFALYLKDKIVLRNVRNRDFQHCGNVEQSNALACCFREVRDAVLWIVDEYRVIVHVNDIVELVRLVTFGDTSFTSLSHCKTSPDRFESSWNLVSHNCDETGLGQVVKLLDARAEVRLTRALGSVEARQDETDKNDGKMFSKWPCKTSKDRVWRNIRMEKTRWRETTCVCNKSFSWPWFVRACAHAWRCADARRQNVHARCVSKNIRVTSECVYKNKIKLDSSLQKTHRISLTNVSRRDSRDFMNFSKFSSSLLHSSTWQPPLKPSQLKLKQKFEKKKQHSASTVVAQRVTPPSSNVFWLLVQSLPLCQCLPCCPHPSVAQCEFHQSRRNQNTRQCRYRIRPAPPLSMILLGELLAKFNHNA